MKKAIIIGATSGIGQEVAKCLLLDGWQIGVAGRRQSALENLQRAAPDQIQIQTLDVTQEDAGEKCSSTRWAAWICFFLARASVSRIRI